MSATAYFTGVCPICDEAGRSSDCFQTFDYPPELNTDSTVGAGKCSVCGEFWPLEPLGGRESEGK